MSINHCRNPLALFVVACMVMAAGSAPAQDYPGFIGLYTDEAGTCCFMYETLFEPNTVYVIHKQGSGAIASSFSVYNNWDATVLLVTYNGTKTGDIFTGVTINYNNNACATVPFLLATITFLPVSPTPPNENILQVLSPDGRSEFGIRVRDCNNDVLSTYGGQLLLNVDPDEIHYTPYGGCSACAVGTEETTWGKVKSLYQ